MKNVIKHILKEEYSDKRTEEYILNYLKKKLDSGKIYWTQKSDGYYLDSDEETLVLVRKNIMQTAYVNRVGFFDELKNIFGVENVILKKIILKFIHKTLKNSSKNIKSIMLI